MNLLKSINWKSALFTIVLAALTSFLVIWGFAKYNRSQNNYAGQQAGALPSNYRTVGLFDNDDNSGDLASFEKPSAVAIPAVVHIKTKTKAKQVSSGRTQRPRTPFDDFFGNDDFFSEFFGNRQYIIPEQQASGSGVIISQDGYIVTNNHVIEGADEVTVTLNNKKKFNAKVVGADPSFDLAVLKIEASGLPYLAYGNSDDVKIGQWVLAIGYPLDLETTVTAGIVSAKSRSIKINKDASGNRGSGVESFIQTDAAVNKGNSGGALINTNGQLIGINSAIFSPTGFYSGYSYAIPVNLVKKVVDDMIKFGNVQRGYLGIRMGEISQMSDEDKKEYSVGDYNSGVVITDVTKNSGAADAGLKKGDVIKKVDGVVIELQSELQEAIAKRKPGDKVLIEYDRGGITKQTSVTLKNNAGNTDIVKPETKFDKLGINIVNLDPKIAKQYNIAGGVVIKRISDDGIIGSFTRMKDGFVVVSVDGKEVKNTEQFKEAIGKKSQVTLGGFYPGLEFETLEYTIPLD